MHDTRALCPACKNIVEFERRGSFNCCPICGSQYPLAKWGDTPLKPAKERGAFADFLIFIVKFFAVLGAIVIVGIAVLFAGCMFILNSHH